MRVELKNVKIHEGLREETTAYTATLYINGVRSAEASNHGTGACDFYRPLSDEGRQLLEEAEKHFATKTCTLPGMPGKALPYSLELKVADLLTDHEVKNQLRSEMRRGIVIVTRDSEVYAWKVSNPSEAAKSPAVNTRIQREHRGADVLNNLPGDEAFKRFKSALGAGLEHTD